MGKLRNKDRYKGQWFIDFDFETRSLADIKEVGAMKYAEHPSTEILMVSHMIEEESSRVYQWNPFFSRHRRPISMLKHANDPTCFFRAFNSEFEFWIWELVATRQLGWPRVPNNRFYDAMGQSCAMAFPAKLETAAEHCRSRVKKKDSGTALITFFSLPKPGTTEFRSPYKYKEKFFEFIDYNNYDTKSQVGVMNRTKVLSQSEQDIMFLTEKMNQRGIPIDMEFVEGALNMVHIAQKRMDRAARAILKKRKSVGVFHSLSQRDAVKTWINEECLVDIPDMKKETLRNWLDEGLVDDDDAETIIKMRLQHAKSSTAKYRTMFAQTDVHGFIHGFIKYYIARTGRWGGRGMQIQNFPKPGKMLPKIKAENYEEFVEVIAEAITHEDTDWLIDYFPDLMEMLAGYLRLAICAPEGYEFISADYSQIEARIVLWVAGSKLGMRDFSGEGKVYEAMAGTIYNRDAAKIGKDSLERFIGKQTVLGSGFGMGWKKFVTSCWDVAQIRVDDETAQKAIDGYRKRYHEVPKLWKAAEKAAIEAVNNPGIKVKVNKHISYKMKGKHLYCKLPSGRELCYPFAQVKQEPYYKTTTDKLFYEGFDFKRRWKLIDTWGGKLVENFVQAMARDIMAHGMMTTERKGYKTCFSVHDESAALVKLGFGSVKQYERLLCILPDWAEGCPVAAEGWHGKRYRK